MLRKSPSWANTSGWSCCLALKLISPKIHTICLGWKLLPEVHSSRLSFGNVIVMPALLPPSWPEERSLTRKLEKRREQGVKQGEAGFRVNAVFLLISWQELRPSTASNPQLSGVETLGTKVHPSSDKQDLLWHLQRTVCVSCVCNTPFFSHCVSVWIEYVAPACLKFRALLLPRCWVLHRFSVELRQSCMSFLGTHLSLLSMSIR